MAYEKEVKQTDDSDTCKLIFPRWLKGYLIGSSALLVLSLILMIISFTQF